MKITLLLSYLFVSIYCAATQNTTSTENTELKEKDVENTGIIQAKQIVKSVNSSLRLDLNDFKQTLEATDIKDRILVVVSVASIIPEGDYGLLDFFLRYLHARVTRLFWIYS